MRRIYHIIYLLLLFFMGNANLLAKNNPMSLKEALRAVLDKPVSLEDNVDFYEPYVVFDTNKRRAFIYHRQDAQTLLRFEWSHIELHAPEKQENFCGYWREFNRLITGFFEISDEILTLDLNDESEWQLLDYDDGHQKLGLLFDINHKVEAISSNALDCSQDHLDKVDVDLAKKIVLEESQKAWKPQARRTISF